MLEEISSVACFSDKERLVYCWRLDCVTVLSEILRMPIGQIGFISLNTERMQRLDILKKCFCLAEAIMYVVDLLYREHAAILYASLA